MPAHVAGGDVRDPADAARPKAGAAEPKGTAVTERIGPNDVAVRDELGKEDSEGSRQTSPTGLFHFSGNPPANWV